MARLIDLDGVVKIVNSSDVPVAEFRVVGPNGLIPVFNCKEYGLKASAGPTKNASAIVDAINESTNPAVIYVPNGVYNIDAGVIGAALTDREGIFFLGDGAPHSPYWPGPTKGSILKCTGGSGVMVDWAASSAAQSLRGNGWSGIALDGNGIATKGLRLASHYGFECPSLSVQRVTTTGVELTTVDLAGIEDFQFGHFGSLSIRNVGGTGKGMTWGSFAAGGGNVSLCKFDNVIIVHENGTGLEMGDSDHNVIDLIECNTTGTGIGVDFLASNHASSGHARANKIGLFDGPGGITFRGFASGSLPSKWNEITQSTGSNNTPFPTIEDGAIATIRDLS